jgi:hypothetical protein
MKSSAIVISALLAAGATVLSAPAPSQAADTTVTISGDIVRYEPGRVIVVREMAGGPEVTYTLAPSLTVPSGLAVGRHVTLYTSPGADASRTVTRITTSVTPEGNVQRTVETTRTNAAGESTRTVTTSVEGTVSALEPGRSLTLARPDGSTVTYVINRESRLPAGLAVGRAVMIRPVSITGSTEPVVQTLTYTTIKHGRTKTKVKTY